MSRQQESVPIEDLVTEDGAHELATSREMQPYLRVLQAGRQGRDPISQVEAIAALPLEKRYIWRVVSALKWALADLEIMHVAVDCDTLSEEDLAKVMELIRLRPMQFCRFLKELVGVADMERIMREAIAIANQEE